MLRFGSGAPGALLLHGYGADGHDLAPIAPMLPGTVLVPSAEHSTPYGGRQWWGLEDQTRPAIALSATDAVAQGHLELEAAVTRIHTLIDELPDGPVLLGGFSQGAMLALAAGLGHPRVGSIVAMSGALARDAAVTARTASPRRVLVAHGRQDPTVPFEAGVAAAELLAEAGHEVEFVPFEGGHGIPPAVLEALVAEARRLTAA